MANNQLLKPFDDEILDVKKQSLYARLKRLFSTDVIVRNVGGKQLKIKDTDNIMYATDRNSLRDRFNRIRSTAYNAYTRDFTLSYQAARMDLFRDYDTMDQDPILSCLFSGTYVSTLEGFVTIKDLAEKYPNGECFKVWSWDRDTQKLTLGDAHHPRKTGIKHIVDLHLDNGEVIKCTPDHRMMLIDGTYKQAGKLLPGESLMPFYHRIDKFYGYQEIKSLGKKYKRVHRYIFEDILEQNVGKNHIHHKNHNKLDNRVGNLEVLTPEAHCQLHGIHPITTGKRKESCKKLWENDEYRKLCSGALKKWRDSSEGKKVMSEHTSFINKERWENNHEYALKMASIFSEHAKSMWNDPVWKEWKRKTHSETMRLKYANDPVFREQIRRPGKENGRYNPDITTESVLVEGTKHNSLIEFAKSFDFKGATFKNNQYRCQFLSRRIKEAGYNGWTDYKNKFEYSNHKVLKIVDNNEITDVYDLTVDIYENFALKQGAISSNSALDIFSDESLTYNEMGKMLTIHSNNHNVKQILENLFTDILNIQFNLWSWVRNMVKYGDAYLKLYITPEYGVYMVEPISAQNVERVENADPLNKRYVKFQIRPTDTAQAEVLENYEVAHFRLISDSNFLPYGKCIRYDSHIDTEFGSKQIKDIVIGDKVWSFNTNTKQFELTSVKRVINSGKKELLRIRTPHNFIDTSKNHPVLIFNGVKNEFEYKVAEDIKIGDLLVINSNKTKKNDLYRINKNITDDKTGRSPVPDIDIHEFILDPVCKIEGGGEHETWDIQVESVNSNFIANRIIVHNSMIEGGRRVWKQLSLLEDSMLISRIMRAPERRIFYTDVGNIPPSEVDAYMEKMMAKMKKVPYMDEQTGEYNLRFNLQNMVDDYYIPVRGGDSGTKIDTLPGIEWTGIEDLEYVKTKMMAALKIPKAFLGFDENMGGKSTLACVVPETQVPLFNGLTKTVKELIDDYSNGVKNRVYSIDEVSKDIISGEIEWAGYTRMNTEVVRVHLGNGEYIDCTPDHRFMIRTGRWIEAQHLVEDTILMPVCKSTNQFIKTLMKYTDFLPINHTVVKVEVLTEKRDTCDITIKHYHNFATEAGVIIHNSEDVRFARTIQRIQRVITSELTKIAIVHLYAQGYRDESLVDFELELTNPSTIFEKEKIEIWSDKVNVASDMVENKFFSYDWIYKNIFNMSEDDIKKVKDEVVEDSKQKYRFTSIEEDGDDPAKPFKKIGGNGGEAGGGGDGGGGVGDLGGGGGGGAGGGKLDLGDENKGKEGAEGGPDLGGIDDLVKETKERDQTGEHDTKDDGEFGPDPLGDKELHRKPNKNSEGRRASQLYQNPEKASPLRLKEYALASKKMVPPSSKRVIDSNLISSLSGFMAKNHADIKKELIKESVGIGSKSMLDEGNILPE